MMDELLKQYIPGLTEAQREGFCRYYQLLLEWNGRMNLTRITEAPEVVQKHFADSLLPLELIPKGAALIDVGTGAGFPGIPIKIVRPDIRLTLLDSLGKRVEFLKAVCGELSLSADCIHARAEDGGRGPLRGRFDVAAARAVAGVSPLAEYLIPFLKKGGVALLYKGPQAEEELTGAGRALSLLQAEGELVRYPAAWGERTVIRLTKTGDTPKAYPRKAGTAAKNPL